MPTLQPNQFLIVQGSEDENWTDVYRDTELTFDQIVNDVIQREKDVISEVMDSKQGPVTRTVMLCNPDPEDPTEPDIRDPVHEHTAQFTVGATEPECTHPDGHEWHRPHEIVGGLEENPGVFGKGGGVISRDVCRHCGLICETDTWDATWTGGGTPVTTHQYIKP